MSTVIDIIVIIIIIVILLLLADHTNSCAYATVLHPSVVCLSVCRL